MTQGARRTRRLAAIVTILLVAQTVLLTTRVGQDVRAVQAAAGSAATSAPGALPGDVDQHLERTLDPTATAPTRGAVAAADLVSRRQLRRAADAAHQRMLADDPGRARFEHRFPRQAVATETADDPATSRWAVVIGINEHLGRVRDNYGSRQDAMELTEHLLDLGWRRDHIVLLTDTQATREAMIEAFEWLGRKTSDGSTAVVHYSGHSKKWYGQDHDGDGEITDEGLWPTDDGFIVDSEFVRLMDAVEGRVWVNIGACESAGFNDPGLDRDGRLLTFSSREDQKSYEDPAVDNSVWGYYLVDRGLRAGKGDADGDGEVTVEEAFAYAAPAAQARTRGQSHGHQSAVLVDRVAGDFSLSIPRPPDGQDGADGGQSDGQDAVCIVGICPVGRARP